MEDEVEVDVLGDFNLENLLTKNEARMYVDMTIVTYSYILMFENLIFLVINRIKV